DWEPVAFVADTAVLDKIKQMLAEPSEQPKFIWAVTIENHGDYIYKRFTEEEYQEVEGVFVPATKGQEEDWTAFQQQMWKNYLIGVHDADKMLGELVKLVQESEQPTIILFFGDHWPSFVEDVEWKILGEQENAVWTTPFLIYDNFTTVQQRGQDYGLMSAFHLGPILLEHACVQPTGLQAWLDKQRNEGILGYNLQVMVTPEGKMVPLLQMDEKTEEVRGQHWMWQYDWLFGKQYSLGENVN
ncbi:sulfatase-like hydrolase/transferase, partial [bacterium]|nr:sulfatase-like hydrolase/transferase [bacterium]